MLVYSAISFLTVTALPSVLTMYIPLDKMPIFVFSRLLILFFTIINSSCGLGIKEVAQGRRSNFKCTILKIKLPTLCEDKIIALYSIVDDVLKGIDHREDGKRKVSDSEVIATALVAPLYFGGHHDNARQFMKMTKLVAVMLDKSHFNRRLHDVSELLFSLFYQVDHLLKTAAGASEYIVDSFPVALCDNIRISRSRIVKGE